MTDLLHHDPLCFPALDAAGLPEAFIKVCVCYFIIVFICFVCVYVCVCMCMCVYLYTGISSVCGLVMGTVL